MMLICDVCSSAYSLYPQHEKVTRAYSIKVGKKENEVFAPQICYACARKIVPVALRIFCKSIPEE